MKKIFFAVYQWTVFLPLFIIISLVNFPGIAIIGALNRGKTNNLTNKYFPFLWSYATLKLAFCKITVIGKENLDKDTPYVFVMNHTTNLDSPLSCMVYRKITWIAKDSLGKLPIFGAAAKGCGMILIDRSKPEEAKRIISEARNKIVEENLSVFVYPEGTRTRDGKLQPFKKGGFVLAEQLGLQVVPISSQGGFNVLPYGSVKLTPGEITLRIHEPLDPSIGVDNLLEESYKIIESDLNGK